MTGFNTEFIEKWNLKIHENPYMDYSYTVEFPNGYGASIIKGLTSYGGDENKWEMALTKNGDIAYEKDFEVDVIGYLSDRDVEKYLKKIKKY